MELRDLECLSVEELEEDVSYVREGEGRTELTSLSGWRIWMILGIGGVVIVVVGSTL